MDTYPSIPSRLPDKYFGKEFYWFPKFDGQNFRAEWNKRRGWYKFGSRNDLVDRTNPYWKPVIELFMERYKVFGDNLAFNHTRAIAFFEYFGKNSFAGHHKEGDEMRFELIDIKKDKRGFDRPETYCNHLENDNVMVAKYSPELIEDVRIFNPETVDWSKHPVHIVCTFEGVVGKRMEGNQLIMVKIKTDAWKQRVRDQFGAVTAHAILES